MERIDIDRSERDVPRRGCERGEYQKLDPAQFQLPFDGLLLGKPTPAPEPSAETSAPEEEKPKAQKSRPTKLGMKNWMFFGSLGAGEDIFLIDTRPANFHAQGLDPEDYLTEVIRPLPQYPTQEQASALTPPGSPQNAAPRKGLFSKICG
jgi:hypothetical protein